MARVFSAIVRIASSVLELLTIKERKKAKQERKQEADAPVQAAEDIRHAVAEGKEDEVNQMLEDARLHRTHGGKAVSALLLAVSLAGSVFVSGCVMQRKPLVLSADRAVVKMELDGVSGWFVPAAAFADLSAAYMAESTRMRIREEAMESEASE